MPEGLAAKRLGLAVSGGPDSMALLLLAVAAFPGQVTVASVDHGLRRESVSECQFVADICATLGVPHETLVVEVGKGNLQEQAREARYAALARWASRNRVDAILTAHHADDQAETLLMRLNRGAGLAGLAGVRARGKLPRTDMPVLRPLLEWSKHELEALVAAAGITPMQDPSNSDERFDRARIRMALGDADWLDVRGFAHSASNLADAEEALEWAAKREWSENVDVSGEVATYHATAPFALQLRVVGRMIAEIAAEPRQGALARLMRELDEGAQANIAGALLKRTPTGWEVSKEPSRRS